MEAKEVICEKCGRSFWVTKGYLKKIKEGKEPKRCGADDCENK